MPRKVLSLDELSKREYFEEVLPLQLSPGCQAVPGEAYTYGSWRGIFDCLRPRRDVFDAIDATTAWEPARRPRRAARGAPEL